jgi:hypothetical protein
VIDPEIPHPKGTLNAFCLRQRFDFLRTHSSAAAGNKYSFLGVFIGKSSLTCDTVGSTSNAKDRTNSQIRQHDLKDYCQFDDLEIQEFSRDIRADPNLQKGKMNAFLLCLCGFVLNKSAVEL